MKLNTQPYIRVGIIETEQEIKLFLPTEATVVVSSENINIPSGDYRIVCENNVIKIVGQQKNVSFSISSTNFLLRLKDNQQKVKVYDVKIGRQFHWERLQEHEFYGEIEIKYTKDKRFVVINVIPIELYLLSVVSSEMSSSADVEYLKAHAVISRSWAIRRVLGEQPISDFEHVEQNRIVKWYGQKGHTEFDVCNDDHCQRYHGFTKISLLAKTAVEETRGEVLTFKDKICNTVFYKACGGVTEKYSTAWEDKDYDYLKSVWDGKEQSFQLLDLTKEENVRKFIDSSPPAFCNTTVEEIKEYLTDFDKETTNFFRWTVRYKKQKLVELVEQKTKKYIGDIVDIKPLKRGPSGRIYLLEIVGQKDKIVVGKELEIRKVLAETHLYSSCFYVMFDNDEIILKGAGWGHGVGLCQIGAAVMAKKGYTYKEILKHYYPGTQITTLY
jgi:stage II sporulation protein D